MVFVFGPDTLFWLIQYGLHLFEKILHELVYIVRFAGDLFQRNRIGCIGCKLRLIHVQSDTGDLVFDYRTHDGVLQ